MELSKMGPPLNSSTATISLRRRPESFRAAVSGVAVASLLRLLSPPRSSRRPLPLPFGSVAPARFPSVLHESPAVRHQDRIYCVPSSAGGRFAPGALSTWQLGVKH